MVEGKVKVSSLGGDVLATAGERVYVRNSLLQKSISAGQPTVKHRMTRLQFQDERMEDIVGIINRTYGSNIELMGDNLEIGEFLLHLKMSLAALSPFFRPPLTCK